MRDRQKRLAWYKAWFKKNKDRINRRRRDRREKDKPATRLRQRRHYQKHRDKYLERVHRYDKTHRAKKAERNKGRDNTLPKVRISKKRLRERLSDGYVRMLISRRPIARHAVLKHIPQSLIAAKREHLKLKRLINQTKTKWQDQLT